MFERSDIGKDGCLTNEKFNTLLEATLASNVEAGNALYYYIYTYRLSFKQQDSLIKRVKKAASSSHNVHAITLLATAYNQHFYGYGLSPFERFDPIALFKKAAAWGDPRAFATLGWIYLYDPYVEKNYPLGIQYLETAATQGVPLAIAVLGCVYFSGLKSAGIAADLPLAKSFFEKGIELNDLMLITDRGTLYYNEGNEIKARELWGRAADLGCPEAQEHLDKLNSGEITPHQTLELQPMALAQMPFSSDTAFHEKQKKAQRELLASSQILEGPEELPDFQIQDLRECTARFTTGNLPLIDDDLKEQQAHRTLIAIYNVVVRGDYWKQYRSSGSIQGIQKYLANSSLQLDPIPSTQKLTAVKKVAELHLSAFGRFVDFFTRAEDSEQSKKFCELIVAGDTEKLEAFANDVVEKTEALELNRVKI